MADWVRTAREELSAARFAQIDLDDLLVPPPRSAVRAALRCVRLACEEVRDVVPQVVGLVVAPLPEADTLTLEGPPMDDLLRRPWEFGPGRSVPGLYLLADWSWSRVWEAGAGEEYRRTLPTGVLEGQVWEAYYRTWRTLGRESGHAREYDRAVYIHTSPTPP